MRGQSVCCITCITHDGQAGMTYSIRLPHNVETRLKRLSARTGRSKSYYVKEAILEHLDDLEDVYLAQKRLEDIRAGRTHTVGLEEVMKRYGMEG